MMSLSSLLSYVLVLVVGLAGGWLMRKFWLRVLTRGRLVAEVRRLAAEKQGLTGLERYQLKKQVLANLKPIDPPAGTPPEAATRFKQLTPAQQHQAVAARERLHLG